MGWGSLLVERTGRRQSCARAARGRWSWRDHAHRRGIHEPNRLCPVPLRYRYFRIPPRLPSRTGGRFNVYRGGAGGFAGWAAPRVQFVPIGAKRAHLDRQSRWIRHPATHTWSRCVPGIAPLVSRCQPHRVRCVQRGGQLERLGHRRGWWDATADHQHEKRAGCPELVAGWPVDQLRGR